MKWVTTVVAYKTCSALWKSHKNAGEELEESWVKKNTEQTSAVEGGDVSPHAPGRRALSK